MIGRIRLWLKLIGFVVVLVWHFIWLMLASALSRDKSKKLFYIRRSFCKAALGVFNIKLEVIGNPILPGGLIISNHRSLLDPLVELSILDVYILSKAEVGSYPMIGKGAKETGVFFVDRNSDQSRKSALLAIEQLLTTGLPVLIYPEGTTKGSDLTGEFRKGSFEIAFNNHIPVIPVMIEYPNSSYYWTDSTLME
ncbi:MAG TPA: lysophospholipid acyltransferase family protein, partial [Saprospiraceae bacterium]|nr:lysophospholipid acyltransferase family protein [Saprospiraceae bacterium]